MTNNAIQTEVMEFVTATAEVKPQRLLPETRLLHDLGIDGDDAVELFDGLHKRFGTDLTQLYEHWSEHFGS